MLEKLHLWRINADNSDSFSVALIPSRPISWCFLNVTTLSAPCPWLALSSALLCSFSIPLSFCLSCNNSHPNECQHVKPTSAHTHALAVPPLATASVNTKASKQNHCPSIEELWLQLHRATNNAAWMSEYYQWATNGDTWFFFLLILNITIYIMLSAN